MQRKTVTISQVLTGTNNFNFQIANINFVPDQVIVRNALVRSLATENTFMVYSDLVGDILFCIGASSNITAIYPDTTFTPRGTNGTWNFSLRDVNQNNSFTPNGACSIYFQLEFIKN